LSWQSIGREKTVGPIPGSQINCCKGFFLLKGRADYLSRLIRYSGIITAVILLTVGMVCAQASPQAAVGMAVTHAPQKSTVGIAQIVHSVQKAPILSFSSTSQASILFNAF
jgi:hypothetical protein